MAFGVDLILSGARLGRLQMHVMLKELLRRIPTLGLARSENTFEFPELGQNAARFLYAVENSIKLDTSSQLRLGSSLSGPD